MTGFGDFKVFCQNTPSYALCNLFYIQLQRQAPELLGPDSQRPFAPVGINVDCGIYKVHTNGSLSNIVNNVICAVAFLVTALLIFGCHKRVAAVGRVEFRALLGTYLVTILFQLLTAGALLEQGTSALGALTAIHSGLIPSLFWVLLWNAFTTLQIWDDGTKISLMIMHFFQLAFFVVTMLISLDTAFGFTPTFGSLSNPPDALKSVPLFVLTSIWPALAALISMITFCYICVKVLNERRPFWIYFSAGIVFIVAQAFRLSPVGTSICQSSGRIADASFIGTLLETTTFVLMYYAWTDITKSSWEEGV